MKHIIELFNTCQGTTLMLVYSVIAVMYIASKVEKKTSDCIYITFIMSIALIYNDFMYFFIEKVLRVDIYSKIIYAFPATLLLSVGLVYLAADKKNAWWKKISFIACVLAVGFILFGRNTATEKTGLKLYADDEVYDNIVTAMSEDVSIRRGKICNEAYSENERVRVAADLDMYNYIRSVDGNYVMPFDFNNTSPVGDIEEAGPFIYSMVTEGGTAESNWISQLLSTECIEYFVIKTELKLDEYMNLVGYIKLGEFGKYTLYARNQKCYPMRTNYWGYIRRVYYYLLGRIGTYEEVYSVIQRLMDGENPLDKIGYELLESEEFAERGLSDEEAVNAIYNALFYRDVQENELYYWKEYRKNGGSYRDIYSDLYYNSGEFKIEWE